MDVFSLAGVFRAVVSPDFDDLIKELLDIEELSGDELDEDIIVEVGLRVFKNLIFYILEGWQAIEYEVGALFEDGLFFEMAAHANKMAEKLRSGLKDLGCRFFVESFTNQIFPVLPALAVKALSEQFLFETWETVDDAFTAVRFVTSWNTTEQEVDALLEACKAAVS